MKTSSDERLRAALVAVRDCADAMEAQAAGLLQVVPELSIDDELRTTVRELSVGLKDTAGRVMFELALLEAEISEGKADVTAVLRRLANLDSVMLAALDGSADVAGQVEDAAERDADSEPAFVLVMQAIGLMLQKLDAARAATAALQQARR
jgi:hypothetical protein